MKNRIVTTLLLLTIGGAIPSLAQSKPDTRPGAARPHRIVFHLATPDTLAYRALTKQLNNVLAYWPTAQLEVVIHNKGIGFMRRDQTVLGADIAALKAKGVVFAVCENTMKQQKLTRDQILSEASYVPVGLAEIVLKEEEGWSYIKAGF